MLLDTSPFHRSQAVAPFDVICAGEARWDLAARAALPWADATSLSFRPGGSAVSVALALAARGLRVGLAAALGDDRFGRALFERVGAAGVDIRGVSLSPPRTGLVFVEGAGAEGRVVSYRQEEAPIAIPTGWASHVLLLTGLSPVVAHAAAFCKEARAARRSGTAVVVDVNARRHVWMGHDPRAIRAVLGQADVVRCSAGDLTALGIEVAMLRAMLRRDAVLAMTDAVRLCVTGPFGDLVRSRRSLGAGRPVAAGSGDAFTAAICAELARNGSPAADRIDVWERVLDRRRVLPRRVSW